jgi:dGTPase
VLAHDLGHTPFGHAGERVLDELMQGAGGFDHNRQSLRVVDLLEDRYPGFRGLNLGYETREGILKHGCRWEHPLPVPETTAQPSLEAQVADLADEVAYTNHDLDDGLRAGLLRREDLEGIALWRDTCAEVSERLGPMRERVLVAQVIVALTNRLVTDLVAATAARLEANGAASVEAVRRTPGRFVAFSPTIEKQSLELKAYLAREFYQHPRVLAASGRAERILGDLFAAYRRDRALLPAHVQERAAQDGELRALADYVAGMTDRFALDAHARLGDGRGGS